MGSLDLDLFFTTTPLDETIDSISSLKTLRLLKVLQSQNSNNYCLATKESNFIFNSLLYKRTDGAAMGSPLGPSLANAFL